MLEFFIKKLEEQYGKETAIRILDGYKVGRKVTFRVNTIKSNVQEIEKVLIDNNIQFEKVLWSKEAFVLNSVTEKDIEELDIYKDGKIYLQSLSSMLPPIILNPKANFDILDMAAAPGGKTTQMAAISENKANITACEMNAVRAERLKYNVQKQGANSVYIMIKDARRIDDFFAFDQILLDAPCSGSGTLDMNDANIEKYFTEKLINKSIATQTAFLKKALTILKSGHEIVYSTCSILAEENEQILEKVMKDFKCEIVPINFEGIEQLPMLPTKIDGTICVCPTEYYEGFFVAKIKKLA